MKTRVTTAAVLMAILMSSEAQEAPEITQKQFDAAIIEQLTTSRLRHETLDAVDRSEIPYAKDFLSLYPNSFLRYLSFSGAEFPSLSITTTLHERYQFNMRVPVLYSKDNLKVIGYGEPRLHLLEVASVTPRDNGVGGSELGESRGGSLQESFGLDEWKKLFESKGDFSSLGFKLETAKPVPHFKLIQQHLKSLERKTMK